jgi:ectoine hydroxylase-related dioxygenase (phytanoyl-CoA dioxygenase family)
MTDESNSQTNPNLDEAFQARHDLRFHPASQYSLQVLNRATIDCFNRDGFLKSLRVFGKREMKDLRSYFDDLLARVLAAGDDSCSISMAHLKHGRVYDVLTHERIVAYVKDLLGEDVVAWAARFFCKMPADGKRVAWHQDASYWPLSPSKTVTVWLAIDDTDTGNGCMRFLAGSHNFGQLTYRESDPSEHNVLDQTVQDAEEYGEPVDVALKAGEISIHSDLLLHGSEANQSDRRRCGLSLRYCSADVRAGMNWNHYSVLVSGEDASGHWANRPRPGTD